MSRESLRILAFGASLTEGYYAGGLRFHPYTRRLQQLLQTKTPVEIVNAGLSGDAILGDLMLTRLKNLLSSAASMKKNFNLVLILAGTNDAMRDQQAAQRIFQGYQLLIDQCAQHGAKILAMTLPETDYPLNSPLDQQRQQFNRLIREDLQKSNPDKQIVVLDVEQQFPQHSLTVEQRQQIWDDGVHLTPRGYDDLGELIYRTLEMYLPLN